jgi:O-antigen ligase
MSPRIATLLCFVVIGVFFYLDREPKTRTSKALWIPIIWVFLVASRGLSLWLAGMGLAEPPDHSMDTQLDGSPIDRNGYLVLLALGVGVLIERGWPALRLLAANPMILAYVAYCGYSLFWSDFADVAFKRWIKSLGDLIMITIVLTDPFDRMAAIRRLIGRVAYCLLPLSVLFIKYYPDLGRQLHTGTWQMTFTGVATQKNGLGALCLITGLGFVWRFISTCQHRDLDRRGWRILAYTSLFGIIGWLLWRSDSKTSMACLAIGTIVMLWTTLPVPRRPVLLHVIVIGLIAAPGSVLFLNTGEKALESMGRDSTLTGRTEIWAAALENAGNPFVGTGFESFWLGERYENIGKTLGVSYRQAHNGYLELYLNLGWIGVVLVAAIVLASYRSIVLAFRYDRDVTRLWLAFFVVTLVYNFTEGAIRMMSITWIAFVLATMASSKAAELRTLAAGAETPSEPLPSDTSGASAEADAWAAAKMRYSHVWGNRDANA